MHPMSVYTQDNRNLAVMAALLCASLIALLPDVGHADRHDELPVDRSHGVRLIELEGGRNFRDLGGYEAAGGREIQKGKLLRSGVLHGLTPADYEIISTLDVDTIVDLRTREERLSEPTFWQAGNVEVMSWDYSMGLDDSSFFENFNSENLDRARAEALMGDLYRDMVHQQEPHYRGMFERLVAEGGTMLLHCSAGKDRTGIGAALLLTALGVDRETVFHDYTVSERILGDSLMEDRDGDSPIASLPEPAIDALMGTRRGYLEAAFAEMREESGSVNAYIREELGMSEQDIQRLRDRYLL